MALVSQSVHFIDSDYSLHFRNPMATFESDYADLKMAAGTESGKSGPQKLQINSVELLSIQQLDWRVEFYNKTIPQATGSPVFNGGLLGYVDFYSQGTAASLGITRLTAQEGTRIATTYFSATIFAYFAQNLNIPYEDRQGNGELHVNLVNLNGTAKNPGDTGAVRLRVGTVFAS